LNVEAGADPDARGNLRELGDPKENEFPRHDSIGQAAVVPDHQGAKQADMDLALEVRVSRRLSDSKVGQKVIVDMGECGRHER
jgi:hypothetical protein